MKTWNVLVPVVDLVTAETAEEAIEILAGRLTEAGFDVHRDGVSEAPDAFESEEG